MFGRGASGVGNPEMTDSERRHADVIKFGIVRQVDLAAAKVRVAIGDEDDDDGHMLTGWLPMAGRRACGDFEFHALEVGERVMVLSESGEVQNGMILPAALYGDDNPAPSTKAGHWIRTFADGASIEYDRSTGGFKVNAKTTAELDVGSTSVKLTASAIELKAGGVTLKVSASGVEISGGSVTHDGKSIGKTHVHTGVQAGSGVSGAPQ